ncbi:hypothetical protein [Desulfotomaculum sp. 1211_IL3151]
MKKGTETDDVLLAPLKDRRLLSNVPDQEALVFCQDIGQVKSRNIPSLLF